jgi:rare lipoprotein A
LFLPYAKLAIFAENLVLENGTASWYKYKGCNCAASPDFPKDTLLKVTNIDNEKSVVVKINDFGPDRNLHPDRVIDLDLTAFKKIGSKSDGIVNIRLEPLDYFIPVSFDTPKNSSLIEVKSKAAILVDGLSGQVLWSKNQDLVLPIASLTKLMTAHVFLQTNTPLDKVVTYQKEDETEGAKVYLQPGDQLTLKDVFYSMLIGSANNMTKLLVRSSGLTEAEFVARMNERAKEWGMTNTYFIEPTGLDPGNVSTAEDLAVLSQKVLSCLEMLWATAAKGYAFTTINTKKEHKFKNTNPLTYQSDLAITGSKTGYLEEAGYCLMTRAKDRAGQEVIAIVLNSPDSATRVNEVEELIHWGFEQRTGSLLAMK